MSFRKIVILPLLLLSLGLVVNQLMFEPISSELVGIILLAMVFTMLVSDVIIGYVNYKRHESMNSLNSKKLSNFIAVEGVDGTGKTLIVEMLKEKLSKSLTNTNITTVSSLQKGTTMEKFIRTLIDTDNNIPSLLITSVFLAAITEASEASEGVSSNGYITKDGVRELSKHSLVVTDRWAWSTLVYAPDEEDTPEMKKIIESMINQHSQLISMPKIILYVKSDMDLILDRIGERGLKKDFFTSPEKLKVYSDRYDKLLIGRDNVITIYNNGSIDELSLILDVVVEEILSRI